MPLFTARTYRLINEAGRVCGIDDERKLVEKAVREYVKRFKVKPLSEQQKERNRIAGVKRYHQSLSKEEKRKRAQDRANARWKKRKNGGGT